MGETEEPGQPADNPSDPARLPDRVDHQHNPAQWDAEQHRRFQEFQEFQQFQRFQQYLQATGGQPGNGQPGPQDPPTPPAPPASPRQPGPPGQPLAYPPVPGHPPTHDVGTQIAGLRQQLAQLTDTQIRIDRAVNPPWWRKVLRSRLIRWLAGLLVLIILAIWGVPTLINHYFGSPGSSGHTGTPQPNSVIKEHEYFPGVYNAVQDVYKAVGDVSRAQQVCQAFSDGAQAQFAAAAGTDTCVHAIQALHTQVTDLGNYGAESDPILRGLPQPTGGQHTFTVPSCWVKVSGGPTLGTFTLTQLPTQQWEITGYTTQGACPPTTSASAPTTPTS